MRRRSRRLVLAAGDDLFHQFHVLNTLLGSMHGFLHQPVALDAEHVILVHKFLDDDARPLHKAAVSSACFALPAIFALSRSRSAQSFALPSPSFQMTLVASSCKLAQPEI